MTVDNALIALTCLIAVMILLSSTSSVKDIITNIRCSRDERSWKAIVVAIIIISLVLISFAIVSGAVYFQVIGADFEEEFRNSKNFILNIPQSILEFFS